MAQTSQITEKSIAINDIQIILKEITDELNLLDTKTKKQINCTVYFLGDNLSLESKQRDSRLFAFVVNKSFWLNKITIELKSASYLGDSTFDDYKIYTTKESLDIFDIESLIIIKHFLLSFSN